MKVCCISLWELSAQTQVFKKVVLLLMLPRWPCCWSSRSQPTTSSLQSVRAVWIPLCKPHSDVTGKCWRFHSWRRECKSQQDFKNSIIKTVCSVSRYKANCKESTDRGIMDAGFSLPCYLNFRKTMKLLSQEVVVILPGENLSFLKPLFQMGCCWICKCMVNRNSMMQNITYNPFNQDPFLPFLLLLTATTSTTVIGADSTCSLCFSSQRNSPQNYLWFPQK